MEGRVQSTMESSSSTRGRSLSPPLPTRRPGSAHSSASSSTSSSVMIASRHIPRPSSSSAASSIQNRVGGLASRSMSLSYSQAESIDVGLHGGQIRNGLGAEATDASKGGDSVSVTIRFRPLR